MAPVSNVYLSLYCVPHTYLALRFSDLINPARAEQDACCILSSPKSTNPFESG